EARPSGSVCGEAGGAGDRKDEAAQDDERELPAGEVGSAGRPPDDHAEERGPGGDEDADEEKHAEDDVPRPAHASGPERGLRTSRPLADRERRHAALVVAVVRDHAPADAVVARGEPAPQRHHELTTIPV